MFIGFNALASVVLLESKLIQLRQKRAVNVDLVFSHYYTLHSFLGILTVPSVTPHLRNGYTLSRVSLKHTRQHAPSFRG